MTAKAWRGVVTTGVVHPNQEARGPRHFFSRVDCVWVIPFPVKFRLQGVGRGRRTPPAEGWTTPEPAGFGDPALQILPGFVFAAKASRLPLPRTHRLPLDRLGALSASNGEADATSLLLHHVDAVPIHIRRLVL